MDRPIDRAPRKRGKQPSLADTPPALLLCILPPPHVFPSTQAETNHLEALRIRVACYGENHESVAQSAQLLSLLLQSEGEAKRIGSIDR